MKRTFKYALATVLSAAMVVPAFAQSSDNFPDVPDNHWAFEALSNLKKAGILVGYPDGLFRGPRSASRYELAVAINAAYTRLRSLTDGLQSQIDALKNAGNNNNAADIQNLRDQLAALQNEVNSLKSYGDDIANLKRLADTFQKELQSLGVDVEAMKRDLGDLARRVTALEKRKPAVDISGDANIWLGAGNSRDDRFGLDMDGRINGTGSAVAGAGSTPVGLTRDLTILHEGAFTFAGTNETGPKWRGTLVVGNMLGGQDWEGFGNQSNLFPAATGQQGRGYAEGPETVYLQDFSVKFDTSVAGLAFNAEVGRVGYKVSPYIYQRIDKTSYFSNERWDDGKYYFDGAILGFNFGGAKIDVIGGRTHNYPTADGRNSGGVVGGSTFAGNFGTTLDPVTSGAFLGQFAPGGQRMTFDRQLGANANIPLTANGNLNLAYLWLESNNSAAGIVTTNGNANRLNVYGGSVDFNFGRIKLEGGYSKSDLMYNNTELNTTDNSAWNAKVGYTGDKWNIYAGYREVEANYLAPGDWGRLGVLRNPTNIRGVQVGGKLDISNALTLKAEGEFDKGKDDAFAPFTSFGEDTKINKFAIDLGYKVSQNFGVFLGYEETRFEDVVAPAGVAITGTPRYRWTTIGASYGLSEMAKLSIQYQISDIEHEYQVTGGAVNGGRFTGGFLTTQLTVKF